MIVLSAAVLFAVEAQAQKKQLDHTVYDSWQKVSSVSLSDDGNVIVYAVSPQQGDDTLYIRNTTPLKKGGKKTLREISIPRGSGVSLDPEGKWLYCRIKPEYAKSRQERIDKKKNEDKAPDTLAVVDLSAMTLKKYGAVKSLNTAVAPKNLVAYKSSWKETEKQAAKDTSEKAESKKPKEITKNGFIILNPASGHADTLKFIDSGSFNEDGSLLVLTSKKDKKDSASVNALIMASYRLKNAKDKEPVLVLDTISSGAESYRNSVFSDDGTMMAFMASKDTSKARNKKQSISIAYISSPASDADRYSFSAKEIIAEGTEVEGTDHWTLNENSSLYFSTDSRRLFTGIAPIRPMKDTTIVDFETAQLDIWNWDAPMTPPMQKKREGEITKKTYLSVINLDGDSRILPLTTAYFDGIRLMNGGTGDWAVSMDQTKYVRDAHVTYDNAQDVALVNLNDGSRKTIAEGLNVGRFSISSEGKYLLWFDSKDLNWYSYDVSTGQTCNLTKDIDVPFYDEEDDRPGSPEAHERSPRWIEGDNEVLIIDRYDVWKFAVDGSSAENITKGEGRSTGNRFRTLKFDSRRLTNNERRTGFGLPMSSKGNLYLTLQNENTKENGFGRINLSKTKDFEYFTDTVAFNTTNKALKSSTIAFTKGNFRHSYDLYATEDWFKSDVKITSINPQMDDYRWGHVELFEWKAYDGTPLKGLVFIPDGIKEGEKLPVMCYFYEKYSDHLYDYWTVAPSRSTVNIPFYTSRGYVVFVPDIVYKAGHPGESAYNCICSGAEALCEKYSFADKSRMAIQGQSWGGYQTAYLVTRTNMFIAAGAGAPVSNMTSAYGGIRWGTGITRAGQYEHGQSRIGKTLWDEGGLDLYIENSPLFKADKVETPLLIMHNDNDGAVPWYQGIEYFSALRRLGKPAWLLEYNNEEHNLAQRKNSKDLSVRLSQFFDHYLKGEPMPAWMKNGVPTYMKSEYFGFEY